LGQGCLVSREDYRPDFCAHVGTETVRCLYLQKNVFVPALLGERTLKARSRPQLNGSGDSGQTGKIAIENQVSRIRGLSGGSSGDEMGNSLKKEVTFQL